MNDLDALLRAIVQRPTEAGQTWLVLADLLEETGDPRHELIRLQHQPGFRPDLDARGRQARFVELLVGGMRPCVPTWTNSIGMRFVWCPPGTFLMGSPPDETGRDATEAQHPVTLTRGFWLGETQVTQAHWRAVTGENPSVYRHDDRPVEHVSFHDTRDFCTRLGQRDGHGYRIPTEAEWEYACRAGTTTPFFWGETLSDALACYDAGQVYGSGKRGKARRKTTRVKAHPPNVWGLYDMHGNLNEWTADRLQPYTAEPATDPCFPQTESQSNSARGGAWYFAPRFCRSAARYPYGENLRYDRAGCRIVAEPSGPI